VDPEVGQRYQLRQGEGSPQAVTVMAVAPERITLDGNHPLAGKELTFEIELVEIL